MTDAADSGVWRQRDGAEPQSVELRLEQLESVAQLLARCGNKDLVAVTQRLRQAGEESQSLQSFLAESAYQKQSRQLTAELDAIEEVLSELTASTAPITVRKALSRAMLSSSDGRHLLQFHLQNLSSNRYWWSHLELVLTETVGRRKGKTIEALDVEAVAEIFQGILPRSSIRLEAKHRALEFLDASTTQLGTLVSIPEVYRLYFEVCTFKMDLGRDYFDPQILYRGARFGIALESWLQDHVGVSVDRQALEADLSNIDHQIDQQFQRRHDSPEALEVFRSSLRSPKRILEDDVRTIRAAEVASKFRPGAIQRSRLSKRVVGIMKLCVVILTGSVGYPVTASHLAEGGRDIQAISVTAAQRIHPLLVSAGINGGSKDLLLATVDSRWSDLSGEARQLFAEDIANYMYLSNIVYASVFEDSVMVLAIDRHEIVYLEE